MNRISNCALLLLVLATTTFVCSGTKEVIPTYYADTEEKDDESPSLESLYMLLHEASIPHVKNAQQDHEESVVGDIIDNVISPIVKETEWDCEPVNFTELNREIAAANSIISFAQNSSVIKAFRHHFDEMGLTVKRTVPMEKSILGVEMVLDTVITKLGISGLRHLVLQPIKATDYNLLNVKATTPEVLVVHTGFNVQFTKKMKSFLGLIEYCPLEWTFWKQCPSYTLGVDATFELRNVELDILTEVNMYQCDASAGFWNKWGCRFTSAWHFMQSLFKLPSTSNGVDTANSVVQEMFRRMRSVYLRRHDITFDRANTKISVKWNKNNEDGGLTKEHAKEAEFRIREALTHGFFKKQIFKSASRSTRDTFNTILSVMEPLYQSKCARR